MKVYMKCAACGYERTEGSERFGKIDGPNGYEFSLRTSKDNYSTITPVSMFVCPKCGTVRIENQGIL